MTLTKKLEALAEREASHLAMEQVRKIEDEKSQILWRGPLRHAYKAGHTSTHAMLIEAVEALENAKLAIEALAETQKNEGLGLLGRGIVAPTTLSRINAALASIERKLEGGV